MGWYLNTRLAAETELRRPARNIVYLLTTGHVPPLTPGTLDAVIELIEKDVLLHTECDSRQACLRALGALIEDADPQPRR